MLPRLQSTPPIIASASRASSTPCLVADQSRHPGRLGQDGVRAPSLTLCGTVKDARGMGRPGDVFSRAATMPRVPFPPRQRLCTTLSFTGRTRRNVRQQRGFRSRADKRRSLSIWSLRNGCVPATLSTTRRTGAREALEHVNSERFQCRSSAYQPLGGLAISDVPVSAKVCTAPPIVASRQRRPALAGGALSNDMPTTTFPLSYTTRTSEFFSRRSL